MYIIILFCIKFLLLEKVLIIEIIILWIIQNQYKIIIIIYNMQNEIDKYYIWERPFLWITIKALGKFNNLSI